MALDINERHINWVDKLPRVNINRISISLYDHM